MDGVTATAHMTAAEFLELSWAETRWWQLIDGEVVVKDPSRMHNESQGCIYGAVRNGVRAEDGRGWVALPLDVRIDDRSVYKPDVAWYGEARAPGRDARRPYRVPDLAVEVRSPSTWRFDIGRKKDNYERHGVGELWLVDTAVDVVHVLRRSAPDAPRFDPGFDVNPREMLTSPLLPGFALAVDEIFELD